ncbi:KilA-N domain-containing protein [Lewinella sp. IMCC34191]|uniref:KilA-N domain-containing protein n=1 Tax=Lewinella sp. IMCC34191 TaxID=2259172 RepID=UPI001E59331F|nr:KilA-N domain-containing protein [Lewinella sp. IMCC34191]
MSTTTQREYIGNMIAFEFSGGNNLINATQMAHAFPAKKVNDFLRLKTTKEFVTATIPVTGIVAVKSSE